MGKTHNIKQEELRSQAYQALLDSDATTRRWILAAFAGRTAQDEFKRRFVRSVLGAVDQMPEWLFAPMIRAAVYEPDASFNRCYIEPCLRCFGPCRVNDALFRYLETGSNVEKAEGFKAFYWSTMRDTIEDFYRLTGEEAVPPEYFSHLRQRRDDWLLTEFLANPHIDVRRMNILCLPLDSERYSPELRPLLPQAIKIAREQ